MGLDADKNACASRQPSSDQFRCRTCSATFACARALQSHIRRQHGVINSFAPFLDASGTCPVCRLSFSSRTRLLAHVTDMRRRGKRKILCRDILGAGVVAPLSIAEQAKCAEQDRTARRVALKRGHTQPRSSRPVKRRAVPSTVPPLRCEMGAFEYSEGPSASANVFDWSSVRPLKRLRSKSSLDVVACQSTGG